MQDIKQYGQKILRKTKHLRLKKLHLDYVAGILSIPVLITAIVINFSNISNKAKPATTTPSPQVVIITGAQTPSSQPSGVCTTTIGPIAISYPQEGQAISDNPVCIIINYPDTHYCSAVWSYRTNNGTWSDYNNDSPCLYNLANGNIQFQLRVKSVVSSDTRMLTRNFMYTGANNPVMTPIPSSTPTPTLTPTPTVVPSPTTVPLPSPTP